MRAAVQYAHRRLVISGRFPGVIAVAAGYRVRSARFVPPQLVTVFVERKIDRQDLKHAFAVPRTLSFVHRGHRHRVQTDVLALEPAMGKAQALNVCDPLALAPGGPNRGAVSWLSTSGRICGVTAEHVVGLGNSTATLFSAGVQVGTVSKLAYAANQIDAALFDLSPGVTPSDVLAGRTLAPPRFVSSADVTAPDNSNMAHVYLPHNGTMHDVAIRNVHVAGDLPLTSPDGQVFYPRPLILTDLCTEPGDSGTVLLGSDWAPIGLLSGITGTYSCFTELKPAVDALLGN